MAKEKKLLVRTPQTVDGKNLAYDENKQPVFSETVVEPYAKKFLESENAQRAEHLRHEFQDVEVEYDAEGKLVVTPIVKAKANKDEK